MTSRQSHEFEFAGLSDAEIIRIKRQLARAFPEDELMGTVRKTARGVEVLVGRTRGSITTNVSDEVAAALSAVGITTVVAGRE